ADQPRRPAHALENGREKDLHDPQQRRESARGRARASAAPRLETDRDRATRRVVRKSLPFQGGGQSQDHDRVRGARGEPAGNHLRHHQHHPRADCSLGARALDRSRDREGAGRPRREEERDQRAGAEDGDAGKGAGRNLSRPGARPWEPAAPGPDAGGGDLTAALYPAARAAGEPPRRLARRARQARQRPRPGPEATGPDAPEPHPRPEAISVTGHRATEKNSPRVSRTTRKPARAQLRTSVSSPTRWAQGLQIGQIWIISWHGRPARGKRRYNPTNLDHAPRPPLINSLTRK